MEIQFFTTASGRSPVVDEIDSLPKEAAAHAYQLLDGIEQYGLTAPRVVFRQIKGKLWEIKMNLPKTGGYRFFYFMIKKDAMLLLHSYSKQTQKAPQREIQTALNRMADSLNRG